MENSWWLVLAILSAATMAMTVFFDNYIVDVVFKNKLPASQKVAYALLEVIAIFVILIFFPLKKMDFADSFLIMASGASYALALVPYYYALKHDNAIVSEIFTQLLPVFNLIFGFIFLRDSLTIAQLIAFVIIFIASFFTIFAKQKREKIKSARAAICMLAAVLLWAVSDLFFAKTGEGGDYITTLFYMLTGRAIVDVFFALIQKNERNHFIRTLNAKDLNLGLIIITDFAIEIISDLVFRFSLLLAPIALVSVVNSAAELVAVFVYGVVLTIIWPKFGREKLTKRNILVNLIAILLMIAGILLIG